MYKRQIKSEMFGDFLQGLNSLEYSATQFDYFSDGSTSYDLPKILQSISLQAVSYTHLDVYKRQSKIIILDKQAG